MLKLKSIYLRNWNRVRETRLEFPDHGFVAVIGNVGSGKTSLGEAISRSLLGVQGRYSNLGWYSLDELGDTYVCLQADLDGELLTVEQGYKCSELSSTGEGLRWRLGNRLAVERGHVRETRAELTALLMTTLLAEWSIFLDGKSLDFSRLSQGDAVQLLLDALAQPPWDKFHEGAKRQLSLAEDGLTRAATYHASRQNGLSGLREAVDQAKERVSQERTIFTAATEKRQLELDRLTAEKVLLEGKLTTLKDEHTQLSTDLKKTIASVGEEYKAAELNLSRLKSSVSEGRQLVTAWDDAVEAAWKARRQVEQELQDMLSVPDCCPTCARPWDKKPEASLVDEARTSVANTRLACEAARVSLDKATAYTKRQREKLTKAEQDLELQKASKVEQFSRRLEQIELERGRVHTQLHQLQRRVPVEPDAGPVQLWAGRLLEREGVLLKAGEEMLLAAQEKVAAERAVALSKYWVRGLGPAGVPNLVLRQVVQPLNEAAEAVSLAMSGGLVKVEFGTDTELATGESKPRLTICSNTRHGAKRLSGNSKGESGLINLVVAEAQSFVGRVFDRVGYRWLDEAVNSQHLQIHRQVYEYIRRQADERKILTFVVDHYADIRAMADHTLLVEKDPQGFTNYRWG